MSVCTTYNNIIYSVFYKLFDLEKGSNLFVIIKFFCNFTQKLGSLCNCIGNNENISTFSETQCGKCVCKGNSCRFSMSTRSRNGYLRMFGCTNIPPL